MILSKAPSSETLLSRINRRKAILREQATRLRLGASPAEVSVTVRGGAS